MSDKKNEPPAQSRSWILTVPEEHYDRAAVVEALSGYTYIGQLEEGESGYRHWQVLIENNSPIRFSTLRNLLPKGHFEKRKGSVQQAVEYVTKEASRVAGEAPIRNGVINARDEKGRRKDIEMVREAVLDEGRSADDVLLSMPEAGRLQAYVRELVAAREREASRGVMRDLTVTYLYGEPGTGKTRWVYENFGDDLCRVTDYCHPFDGYTGENALCLDEFDGQIEITEMNTLADIYPLELPARYYNRPARFTDLILVSNKPPSDHYRYADDVLRRAFRRRIHRVLLMEDGGQVREVSGLTGVEHTEMPSSLGKASDGANWAGAPAGVIEDQELFNLLQGQLGASHVNVH